MAGIWLKAGRLGKRGYQFRLPAGIGAAILLLVHQVENQITFSWVDYVTLIAVLIIPHLYLIQYVKSGNDRGVALSQITNDLLLAGWIAGSMDLSVVPSTIYALTISTTYIATRGFNKLYRILLIPGGMFLAIALQGFHFHFQSTNTMVGLSLFYGVVHFTILSYVSYVFSRHQYLGKKKVEEQKHEIHEKTNEILTQAEELKALNDSLQSLNENLEKRIQERKEDLKAKNEKLVQYAFVNAHQLRAPVATISGLVHLFDYSGKLTNEESGIIERLKSATNDLDEIVHEIKFNLEKEEFIDKKEDKLN